MMEQRDSQNSTGSNNSIIGNKKPRKPFNPRLLLPIGGVIILLLGLLIGILIGKSSNSGDSNDNTNQIPEITYEETVTPNAYGEFLSVALKGFYLGGNTNGVSIPTHNYYPSTADLKDREWTKKNMQLDDRMHELITSGEVVYEPKGCNADQPSGEQNKCSDFVVKSGDSVLFDSTKKD